MFHRHRLPLFISVAVLVLLALSVLWTFAAEGYDRFLLAVTNGMAGEQITLRADAGQIYFYAAARPDKPVGGISSLALNHGLILLVVLAVATPGMKLTQRAIFVITGLVLAFLIQVVGLSLVAGKMASVLRHGGDSKGITNIIRWLIASCGLFPPLLWATYSLRYWLSIRRPTTPA